MKNIDNEVIYIGKAKNLRLRIKSYFTSHDVREQIPFLMKHLDSIDTILVSNDIEALLLENNLIKTYRPKYNILLKDDKSFFSLLINKNTPWPRIDLIRTKTSPKKKSGIIIFGPFPNSESCKTLLKTTQQLFPLRSCSDREFKSRKRPCLLYDMKQCIAPCVNLCTQNEYDILVKSAVAFLKNGASLAISLLKKEIKNAVTHREFEKASGLYETVKLLEKASSTQQVEKTTLSDMDVIGLFQNTPSVALTVLMIRKGKLLGGEHHFFENSSGDMEAVLSSFVLQYYEKIDQLPPTILVPLEIDPSVEQYLKIKIITSKTKKHLEFISMARNNAENHLRQTVREQQDNISLLDRLQEDLGLVNLPKRIECYDNSHTRGDDAVSVFVCFIEGKPFSKDYRTFIAKQDHRGDDYGLLTEVLRRRFSNSFSVHPDLIIIDGGKGHLSTAVKALKELNVPGIDVIAIAKESGKHDKGLRYEKIFTTKHTQPLSLEYKSPLLLFIQKIRDEAHRFAIKFHNKRRHSSLLNDNINLQGIGPAKRTLLLKTFGSWKAVFEADVDLLRSLKGLSKNNIETILKRKRTYLLEENKTED